jgi:DNA-binding response OmpR family regulator
MPIRVLAIDDDSAMTELLALFLRGHGYEVLTANRGLDGVEMARNHAPDIVILDLMMPGVDGWDVCRGLRSFSPVPIIILSAIDMPGNVTSALDAGADDYLIKPVPSGVLIAHINNLTRRATAQRDCLPIGRQTASPAAPKAWGAGG